MTAADSSEAAGSTDDTVGTRTANDERWTATLFDGRGAAGEVVLLAIEGDTLVILKRRSIERIPIARIDVPEWFAHAPRMLRLPDHATLEVPDPERTLPRALAAAGVKTSWVVRLQKAWPAALASLLLVIAVGALLYRVGIPVAARVVAEAIPIEQEQRLGEEILQVLAREYRPSALDPKTQARIAERFGAAAAKVAPDVPVRLVFHAGGRNAFALPGGTIVLLDDLVAFAKNDDAVLGVLGHELGHVVHRHSMRQLAQALSTAAFASLVWGDFSGVAANVPVLLGVLNYGRAFEEEADNFGLEFLAASDISPRPLHDFFVGLVEEGKAGGTSAKRGEGEDDAERRKPARRGTRAAPPDFLSSHPSHASRIEKLREAAEAYERRHAAPAR